MNGERIERAQYVNCIHGVKQASNDLQNIGTFPHLFIEIGGKEESEDDSTNCLWDKAHVEEDSIEPSRFELAANLDIWESVEVDEN